MGRVEVPDHTVGTFAVSGGVRLGYRRVGRGVPVLLWHGGLITSFHLLALGERLAGAGFEVWVIDRRGRGLSGGEPSLRVEEAVEDVAAAVALTGARRVFGLSAGAVPVLGWALVAGSDCAVAVYEPPLGAALTWYRGRGLGTVGARGLVTAFDGGGVTGGGSGRGGGAVGIDGRGRAHGAFGRAVVGEDVRYQGSGVVVGWCAQSRLPHQGSGCVGGGGAGCESGGVGWGGAFGRH